MIEQIAKRGFGALGIKSIAKSTLRLLGLEPVSQIPQSKQQPDHTYRAPIRPEELEGKTKISFPQADTHFHPPLFHPTETAWPKDQNPGGVRCIKNAFLVLHATMKHLGYAVNDCDPPRADMVFDWAGKRIPYPYTTRRPPLIMEVGWIPRQSYQISDLGANARSHVAQDYQFRQLSESEQRMVRVYVDRMRKVFSLNVDAVQTARLTEHLQTPFILFPLQLAGDFNLRFSNSPFRQHYGTHPRQMLAFAQACVDFVEAASPPLPVFFKQHPMDHSDLESSLTIHNRRNRLITNTQRITTTELFATGLCRLVVSVNSNTLHEGLIWGVPGIALGTLVWNEEVPPRPFPKDLAEIDRLCSTGSAFDDDKLSYLYHLIRHQWFLSDFANPLIVRELVRTQSRCVPLELRLQFGLEYPVTV